MKIKNLPKANRQITAQRVKIVNEDGTMLGEFHIKEAMRIARQKELDLVEVAPKANPPVCRLMDFGRYLYAKKRQERESRKHQHRTTARGMRFSLKISDGEVERTIAEHESMGRPLRKWLTDAYALGLEMRLAK